MKFSRRWTHGVVALSLLAGCKSVPPASTPAALAGSDWRLLDVNGAPAFPAERSAQPWLHFDSADNRVSGNLGCNRINGPYLPGKNNKLRFGALISTRMACVDQRMNEQEYALGVTLSATDAYRVVDDTLELIQLERVIARFVRR